VAAVAGCVKVANPGNLLTRWQEVEYMIGQNLDRQALEYVNGMNTVPGALGAFRREVIKEVGGYQPDTLAEDTDITIRILRRGYLVGYAPKAIAVTEAPETVKQLLRQRFRWSYGALQTVWKHRGAFLDSTCAGFAWFTLPQVMIFQLLLPFLVPLADVVLIASIAGGAGWDVVLYGLMFLAIDCAAAGVALVLAGEGQRLPYLSMMLVSQKFGYRYFVFVPLFKAFIAAIHGRAVGWGHLQRLGRVSQAAASAN
jgi:peptidoglycan-N-acetylglucosamine deacetylase